MCLNDPISKLGDVNARKMCLRPAQGVTVGSFLEIKTALMQMLTLIVHTLEHVIRIYTNLTRKESESCGELLHHNTNTAQPPSNLWMASFWFPEAGDGECLRYLEMRKVSGHVMINWHRQPSSRVNRGRVCSSYLTFGCHSLHPNDGIRETVNFQNITSRGRILDKISLTEIKILIHSIQIPLKERKKSSQHKQIYSDKADSAENFKCIKNQSKK